MARSAAVISRWCRHRAYCWCCACCWGVMERKRELWGGKEGLIPLYTFGLGRKPSSKGRSAVKARSQGADSIEVTQLTRNAVLDKRLSACSGHRCGYGTRCDDGMSKFWGQERDSSSSRLQNSTPFTARTAQRVTEGILPEYCNKEFFTKTQPEHSQVITCDRTRG